MAMSLVAPAGAPRFPPRPPGAELLATRAVEEAGQRIAFPRDSLAEVKLGVVEACLNAIEDGTGEVEVEVIAHPNYAHPWIEIAVVDHGPGFDPSGVPKPVLSDKLRSTRKRGWGVGVVRSLMAEGQITSRPGLTRVRMIRRRGGE